jgi:hypothetical protein
MSAKVYESREMNHVLFISVHSTQGSILPHCRRVDSKLRLRSAVTRARLWRDLWCSVTPNNPPGHQNDRHQWSAFLQHTIRCSNPDATALHNLSLPQINKLRTKQSSLHHAGRIERNPFSSIFKPSGCGCVL